MIQNFRSSAGERVPTLHIDDAGLELVNLSVGLEAVEDLRVIPHVLLLVAHILGLDKLLQRMRIT